MPAFLSKQMTGAALLAVLLAACGGGSGDTPPAAPATPATPVPPTLTLVASSTRLLAGSKPVGLSATVSSTDTISWTLSAGAPGSLSASSGASVNYLPPASVGSATAVVTATASAGGVSKAISFTVYPDPGPAGLSLIAGGIGAYRIQDGSGTAALFNQINAVVEGSDGNQYVADRDATRRAVRKVTPAGVVTTVYSSSDAASDDTYSIAPASDGALYVLEHVGSPRLRKIASDGTVSQLLNGSPVLAQTVKLAAGSNGAIYLIAPTSIERLGSDGALSLLAGDPSGGSTVEVDGTGSAARFRAIAVAESNQLGDLLLYDLGSFRSVSAAGGVVTVLQSNAGNATPAPLAMSHGADNSFYLLSATTGTYQITRVMPDLTVAQIYQQSAPVSPVTMPYAGLKLLSVADDGTILLASTAEIRKLDGNQQLLFVGDEDDRGIEIDGNAGNARFSLPQRVAADTAGNIYVADHVGGYTNMTLTPTGLYLRKIAPGGQVSTLLTDSGFGVPSGMAADRNGNIYVSEQAYPGTHSTRPGGTIHKITPDGTMTVLAGPATPDYSGPAVDGAAAAARFTLPVLLGVDTDGNVYVNDNGIRKITPDGTTSTIAALPAGLLAAPDGNVYAIRANDTVVKVAADGSETVVAGVAGQAGTVLGALPGGLLQPAAVVPTGLYSFAVLSGEAVLRLVLPH